MKLAFRSRTLPGSLMLHPDKTMAQEHLLDERGAGGIRRGGGGMDIRMAGLRKVRGDDPEADP